MRFSMSRDACPRPSDGTDAPPVTQGHSVDYSMVRSGLIRCLIRKVGHASHQRTTSSVPKTQPVGPTGRRHCELRESPRLHGGISRAWCGIRFGKSVRDQREDRCSHRPRLRTVERQGDPGCRQEVQPEPCSPLACTSTSCTARTSRSPLAVTPTPSGATRFSTSGALSPVSAHIRGSPRCTHLNPPTGRLTVFWRACGELSGVTEELVPP